MTVAITPDLAERVRGALSGVHFVAGSYERLLYGLELKSSDPCDDKKEQDTAPKSKKQRLLESAVSNVANATSGPLRIEPSYVYPAHISCIKTLAANQRFLVSGSSDELIKIYDLKLRKEVGVLMHHSGSITCTQFFGRSSLITASEDGKICLLRTKDWEVLKTLSGHKHGVNSISIHPTGKLLLSTGHDSTLKLWDLTTGSCAYQMKLTEQATHVLWSPQTTCSPIGGDYYVVLGDKLLTIHQAGTGATTGTIVVPTLSEKFTSMAFISLGTNSDKYVTQCLTEDAKNEKWCKSLIKLIDTARKNALAKRDEYLLNKDNIDDTKLNRGLETIASKLGALDSIVEFVERGSTLTSGFFPKDSDKVEKDLLLAVGYESGKIGLYSIRGKLLVSLFTVSDTKNRIKDMDYFAVTDSSHILNISKKASSNAEVDDNSELDGKKLQISTATNILTTCESDGHVRVFLAPELPQKLLQSYVAYIMNADANALASKFTYPKLKEDLCYDAKCRLTCVRIAPGLAKQSDKA